MKHHHESVFSIAESRRKELLKKETKLRKNAYRRYSLGEHPENIIAEETGESLEDSLQGALDSIERQVWKRRKKPNQLMRS
jgi:hypothetical protein